MHPHWLIEKVPTLRALRGWLVGVPGVSGRHLGASFLGAGVLLALAALFLTLAVREHRADARRAIALQVLRLATNLEHDLSHLEVACRGFLLSAQQSDFEQFSRRRVVVQGRFLEMIPLLHDQPATRDWVRRMSTTLHRWVNEGAQPEMIARQQRSADTRSGSVRELRAPPMDELRMESSRFVRHASDAFDDANAKAKWHRIVQTCGFVLLSLLAICFLIASSWTSYAVYRRHLRKTEEVVAQTRAIIDTTLDGVITVDDQGRIQSMNPAAERMFVQKAEQLIGMSISRLIPQRLFFHEMSNVGRGAIMAMGQRQGYYPFPIEVSLSEMHVAGRRQFVAIVRDVTERTRSEETLKHISLGVSASTGEEFLRSLLKQLSKALQNDFAFLVELVGTGADSLSMVTIAEQGNVRSTASHDLTNTAFEEALTKGFRAYLGGARQRFPEDTILQDFVVESFVASPLIDHKGHVVGLIGVLDRRALKDAQVIESTLQIFAARAAAEIERKRFEEALAAEKDRLAVTLRSIGDGFITIDNSGQVLMLNTIAEQLTGWSQEEAKGKPLGDVFNILSERNRRRCQHAIQRIIESGNAEGMVGPAIIVSQTGIERTIESNSAPIRDKSNRKVGVVIVFRDVTERQRLQEERQKADKLESLGVVAGGIAHDFNNLLTAILGNLTLALLSPELEPRAAEWLGSAKKATTRAQELAQQLLTFAKGGAPIKQTAAISQLLRDTMSFSLRGLNVRSEFQFSDDLWPVDIDPGQISQVINNLAINAEQAMPAGGAIRVSAENVDLATESVSLGLRAGRWVRIELQDEGIGIAEEYLKKIFDPYFTTKPKGSGLGLATVYSIVKNHNGVLAVESKPGAGSTFTICLPASEKDLPSEQAAAAPPATGNARVLVLDDEEAICMLVTCALESLGYEVTETNDGTAAIAAYRDALTAGRKYDLVISDLTIPGGMGGQETIKRLREIDPEVRAIVSSGYANDPIMSRHEDYGFCGMIAKPYEIDALGRKVAEILSQPQRQALPYDEFEERRTA